MPNHLHLLVYVGNDESTINTLLVNGKRFLAYEIVTRLENTKQIGVLQQLAKAVSREEKDKKKKHRVFEVSSDIKPCYYESYLLQKLNYIHSNPVRGKWKLAATPEGYLHSSSAFYELNQMHPFVRLTHYKGGYLLLCTVLFERRCWKPTHLKQQQFRHSKASLQNRNDAPVTVDDLIAMPEEEQKLVCRDLLLADELDITDNRIRKTVTAPVLDYCRSRAD